VTRIPIPKSAMAPPNDVSTRAVSDVVLDAATDAVHDATTDVQRDATTHVPRHHDARAARRHDARQRDAEMDIVIGMLLDAVDGHRDDDEREET
jgi:hypothetical protein